MQKYRIEKKLAHYAIVILVASSKLIVAGTNNNDVAAVASFLPEAKSHVTHASRNIIVFQYTVMLYGGVPD